jgi:hypothetical protein
MAFCIKLGFYFLAWRFTELNWLGLLGEMITRIVAPLELPLWQILSAINAILACAFFFRAHRHLLAQGTSETLSEQRIRQEYVTFQAVRTAFSLFSISCTFYIAAAVASRTEWPHIRVILFPWGAPGGV